MALRLRTVLGLGGAAALAGGIALTGLPEVKAQNSAGTPGISFRWNNNKDFKNLYFFVSNQERDTWSEYKLILKSKDRKAAIIKLDVTVPSYFDSTINPKEVALKYCQVGGALKSTRCNETIPATVELANDGKTLEIFPESPVPPNKAIGVVFPVYNPGSGMYQFNALAQAPGDVPMAGYLGSWVIEITDGIDG
jgi:hypothetical protein|tara:strand:- start:631 stop:1212 length:582 start_codon:yes stop_codon:yes gene_type:complete